VRTFFVLPAADPGEAWRSVATKKLPSRPNLDHLRRQAKSLLADLRQGDAGAIQTVIEHLPEARKLTPAKVRAASFRLADAQSVIARKTGFASWPGLARHVEQLRSLEGEWQFDAVEVDGNPHPTAGQLLIDGDRFRMESPEATYEGVFTIDVDAEPPRIDIDFVEGPEAGNRCEGIYQLDGDRMTMCLGLVGSTRPTRFATSPGSGHALERLRRASAARPANVTGGTPQAPEPAAPKGDAAAFDVPMTDLLRRLEGEWVPVELVMDGKPMPAQWLAMGSRTATGNEVKVVFGGQTMVHAKVRIDETVTPIAVDYFSIAKSTVSHGIMEWIGDEARFLMAHPGQPRPTDFTPANKSTLSRWRRR